MRLWDLRYSTPITMPRKKAKKAYGSEPQKSMNTAPSDAENSIALHLPSRGREERSAIPRNSTSSRYAHAAIMGIIRIVDLPMWKFSKKR